MNDNNRHKRMVDTRRLYKFENTFLHPLNRPHLNRQRSLKYLEKLAAKVWQKHGRKGLSVPRVKITNGRYSLCRGFSEIELATAKNTNNHIAHDTIEVLIHELVHAMGYGDHSIGFVRKYVQLLVEYGDCETGELCIGLSFSNIRH